MELRRCFDKYDTARNGIITQEEFKEALKESNLSDEIVKGIFESIDINKNGHIMYTGKTKSSLSFYDCDRAILSCCTALILSLTQ